MRINNLELEEFKSYITSNNFTNQIQATAMPGKELRDLLKKLDSEIKNINHVDKSSRDLLDGLKKEINDLLERDDKKIAENNSSLADRLRESTEHFEASHPELTAVMNNVINFLNNLGL